MRRATATPPALIRVTISSSLSGLHGSSLAIISPIKCRTDAADVPASLSSDASDTLKNDFNVKAKRDINLEAAGNVNIKANEQMRLESGNRTHWKVGTAEVKKDPSLRPELGIKNEDGTWKWDSFESLPTVDQPGDNLYIDVSRDVYWKVGTHPKLGDFKLEVSQDGHATFDRDFFLLAKRNIHQHSNKKTYHAADTTFDQKSGEEFYQHSGLNMHIKSDKHLRIYADVNACLLYTSPSPRDRG